MAIDAVIFDFNGVLVDDESVHFALFKEVLAEEGVHITQQDYHNRYMGYDDRGCFEAALADANQSTDRSRIDDLIARKARRYVTEAARGLRFFPSAAETLGAIAAHWPVAINSGALRPEIEYALDRIDRRAQVAAIISAEAAEKCKPDPEGYLLALAALRKHPKSKPTLAAANCLVIEDTLAGIASARSAGMKVVGVTTSYTPEELRAAGADDVIESLTSFTPAWIRQRFSEG